MVMDYASKLLIPRKGGSREERCVFLFDGALEFCWLVRIERKKGGILLYLDCR